MEIPSSTTSHPRRRLAALAAGCALLLGTSGCDGDRGSSSGAPSPDDSPPAVAAPSVEVPYADLGYDSKTRVLTLGGAPFTGIAVETHPNGRRAKAYEVHAGVFEGVVREWYPDGTPQTVTHFKAGARHGTNTYWNPDGSLLKEQVWNEGVLVEEPGH